MDPGTILSIGFPYRVYLNVISQGEDETESSDFNLNITYVKYDPNAKDQGPEVEDKIIIQNKTVTTKIICKFLFSFLFHLIFHFLEKDLWESGDFVIIISVALVAVVFIIILISALIYLKIKGEKMSKVETLSPGKSKFPGGSKNKINPSSRPNFGDDS